MLLIASESVKGSQTIVRVARELSLVLGYFASPETLTELLGGRSRRIVMLTEADISSRALDSLHKASSRAPFGIIVAADRDAVASGHNAGLLDTLDAFEVVEWIEPEFDAEWLSSAARQCRRHMLRHTREDLENAIASNELILQYQPKVRQNDGTEWEAHEVEALLRWRHPSLGLIGPLEFLPEIEAFELSRRVGEHVLLQTARQLAEWRKRGLVLKGCINLASSLLMDDSVADRYATIVADIGLKCEDFTLEITERDLASHDAPHLKTLGALRGRGFRICLDDFRVAATSLGVFENLPFDEIKIQASALKHAHDNPVSIRVLAAVTGLARSLGISVCVAGIEDLETVQFLKSIDCDKMQGFLISEAVMPNIVRRVYAADIVEVA